MRPSWRWKESGLRVPWIARAADALLHLGLGAAEVVRRGRQRLAQVGREVVADV